MLTWGDDGVGLLKEMSLWSERANLILPVYHSIKEQVPHWYCINATFCRMNHIVTVEAAPLLS